MSHVGWGDIAKTLGPVLADEAKRWIRSKSGKRRATCPESACLNTGKSKTRKSPRTTRSNK